MLSNNISILCYLGNVSTPAANNINYSSANSLTQQTPSTAEQATSQAAATTQAQLQQQRGVQNGVATASNSSGFFFQAANSARNLFNATVFSPLETDYSSSTVSGDFIGALKISANAAINLVDVLTGGPSGLAPQFTITPNERFGADLAGVGLFASAFLRGLGVSSEIPSMTETMESTEFSTPLSAHPLDGWTADQVVQYVNQLGVQTPRDQLLLWSGLGRGDAGVQLSQEYAALNGGMTLEMTAGGKWLNQMDLFAMNSPFAYQQAVDIWAATSKLLVQQASGQVRALLGAVRPNSIYISDEFLEIQDNPNILGVDELYLKPKYQFGNY